MSRIKRLSIRNFLGVKEFDLEASKINIFRGPNGHGKTSILEAIAKAYTGKKWEDRSPVIVKDDSDEAMIFIEQDDGMSIDRRIRTNKSDYLKIFKDGKATGSTESELRELISGEMFRPIAWLQKDIKEQTEDILNMLEIDWSKEDIEKWFGKVPKGVSLDKHILKVLKDIEQIYYDERRDVNREIRENKAIVDDILSDLPDKYDGEYWEKVNLSDLYDKLNKAIDHNNQLEKRKERLESISDSIDSIKLKYKELIDKEEKSKDQEIKSLENIIQMDKDEIKDLNNELNNIDDKTEVELKDVDYWLEKEIQKLKEQAQDKKDTIKANKEQRKDKINTEILSKKSLINDRNIKIDNMKETTLLKIDSFKDHMGEEVNKVRVEEKELSDYVENAELIDTTELKVKADNAEKMKGYLREYYRMRDINEDIETLQLASDRLTQKIDTARNKPSNLIKTAKMPIPEISVDSEGNLLVYNRPLNNMSDGEKFTFVIEVAKYKAGNLKLICMDKLQELNPARQKEILNYIKDDDYQYFMTDTQADEFEIQQYENVDGNLINIETGEILE
ncbi:MAG: hypothetical protein FH761_16540 [Firmicutes bacterium]|nr:hypothetical protein [Bacillota bacterium]